MLGFVQTLVGGALRAGLLEPAAVVGELSEEVNFKCVYFEIIIDVDESFTINVNFIKLVHH